MTACFYKKWPSFFVKHCSHIILKLIINKYILKRPGGKWVSSSVTWRKFIGLILIVRLYPLYLGAFFIVFPIKVRCNPFFSFLFFSAILSAKLCYILCCIVTTITLSFVCFQVFRLFFSRMYLNELLRHQPQRDDFSCCFALPLSKPGPIH